MNQSFVNILSSPIVQVKKENIQNISNSNIRRISFEVLDTFDLSLFNERIYYLKSDNYFYILLPEVKKNKSAIRKYSSTTNAEKFLIKKGVIFHRKPQILFAYDTFLIKDKKIYLNMFPKHKNLPVLFIKKENPSSNINGILSENFFEYIFKNYFTFNLHYSNKISFNFAISPPANLLKNIADSFHKILKTNEEGVISNNDKEFLHDYRTTIRRFRVLLQFLGTFNNNTQLSILMTGIKKCQKESNKLRDLDVFIDKLSSFNYPRKLKKSYEELVKYLIYSRENLFLKYLKSSKTIKLGNIFEDFDRIIPSLKNLNYPDYTNMLFQESVLIIQQIKTIILALKELFSYELLHKLRIRIKILRYLLELNKNLFPAKDYIQFEQSLKSIQSLLGDFNDLVIQIEILTKIKTSLITGKINESMSEALGFVYIQLANNQNDIIKSIRKKLNLNLYNNLSKKVDNLQKKLLFYKF